MPRHSFKGGKILMVRGGLTEPAAWIRVIAEVVIESGSMSEFARFGGLPCLFARGACYNDFRFTGHDNINEFDQLKLEIVKIHSGFPCELGTLKGELDTKLSICSRSKLDANPLLAGDYENLVVSDPDCALTPNVRGLRRFS